MDDKMDDQYIKHRGKQFESQRIPIDTPFNKSKIS